MDDDEFRDVAAGAKARGDQHQAAWSEVVRENVDLVLTMTRLAIEAQEALIERGVPPPIAATQVGSAITVALILLGEDG